KGIGETNCATGDRRGHIEKWNADGGAAALVFACSSGEGSDEFFAGGVILHGGGIGFRVGENLSGGIDDGGAGSGGDAVLRGDFGEGVGAVVFDAMGEENCLLREVALDLGAQGG